MSLVQTIKQNIVNIPGWRTKRKIVVIESDDWGSIRMNKDVNNYFKNKDIYKHFNHYDRNDGLESIADLDFLFETLFSIKNDKGANPIFTANTVIFNPNFEQIRNNNYDKIYLESFDESYKKFSDIKIENIIQGVKNNIFKPQFHGSLHVNKKIFEKNLMNKNSFITKFIEFNTIGVSKVFTKSSIGYGLLSTYGFESNEELEEQIELTIKAINMFNNIFNFRSKSFIAPQNIVNKNFTKRLSEYGIKIIQGSRVHKSPNLLKQKLKHEAHILGEINKSKQVYMVRNCTFEPSFKNNIDWVSKCLKEIEVSFRWFKPAIITTHRVNYIGSINIKNRDDNLIKLKALLSSIVYKWPDVEFMSSDELGELILKQKRILVE